MLKIEAKNFTLLAAFLTLLAGGGGSFCRRKGCKDSGFASKDAKYPRG